MPIVSVIVPVYNSENYLERCVNSILAQTFKDFELILVDDGSLDSSGKICERLKEKDERIVVIHKNNGGISDARNKGLEAAKGDYILFCDNDDTVEPKWIELLYKYVIQFQDSLVTCKYASLDMNTGVKRIMEIPCVEQTQAISYEEYYILYKYVYSSAIWIRIYRADIIRKNSIRFNTTIKKGGEDTLFNIDYMKHCNDFFFVDECLYNWIDNGSSASRDYEPHSYQKIRDLYFPRLPYISSNYLQDFYDEYFWRIYNCFQICEDSRNTESENEKTKYCNYILRDSVFIHTLNHASENACGKKLKFVLKLKNYKILKMFLKYTKQRSNIS